MTTTVHRNPTIDLGLHGEKAAVGDHIAYFWESAREFEEGVGFLIEGLGAGDFCVVFGHPAANQRVCDVLTRRGFDCEASTREGRLAVVGGEKSGDGMLARIGEVFTGAVAGGAPLIRLLGNIGWAHADWPEEDDILAFEAKVTGAARGFPCVVVCMYDVRALSGRVMMHGAFETHPLTFCRNVLRENTQFVPAEQFLQDLKKP